MSPVIAYSSDTSTTEEADIDMNEVFYLRTTANKITGSNLSVEVTSPSLTNNRCTLTTKTLAVNTSGDALNF